MLAETVVINEGVHSRLLDGDVALFTFARGTKPGVRCFLQAIERLAILADDNLANAPARGRHDKIYSTRLVLQVDDVCAVTRGFHILGRGGPVSAEIESVLFCFCGTGVFGDRVFFEATLVANAS